MQTTNTIESSSLMFLFWNQEKQCCAMNVWQLGELEEDPALRAKRVSEEGNI